MYSRYDPEKDDDKLTVIDVIMTILVMALVWIAAVLFLTIGK